MSDYLSAKILVPMVIFAVAVVAYILIARRRPND